MFSRDLAAYRTMSFMRRTFPLIPLLPIAILFASVGLSIAALVKANRAIPSPA